MSRRKSTQKSTSYYSESHKKGDMPLTPTLSPTYRQAGARGEGALLIPLT